MDSITLFAEGCGAAANTAITDEVALSLYAVFASVPDKRERRGRRYEAALVLTCMLLAKLAGEETMLGIAQWVRHRAKWLGEVFQCDAFPCANTYCNICKQVDAQDLNARLSHFFSTRLAGQDKAPLAVTNEPVVTNGEKADSGQLRHLACDGKELRGTYRYGQKGGAVLGVYDVAAGTLQSLTRIAGKGYEIAALRSWLKTADLSHCLITADALHTQTETCTLVRARNGHYLLIAKENQPQLRDDIRSLFALPPTPRYPREQAQSAGKRHGRQEVRRLCSSTELNDLLAARWQDVAQVFELERTITSRGVTTTSHAYGLTSLTPEQASAKQLLKLIRQHWAIENRCHWRRDATLGEDRCKVMSHRAAATLAALNSAILALAQLLKATNLRSLRRQFSAQPAEALALILQPL